MTSEEIRAITIEKGRGSWSTHFWQNDILDFIAKNKDKGTAVIEVGCALGGNTCLLANLCSQLGLDLYVVDTSPEYVDQAKSILKHFDYFGIKDRIFFNIKTLFDFAEKHKELKAIAVIIDADHSFDPVIKDIGATFKFLQLPHGIIFHDYNLRLSSEIGSLCYAILAVDFAIRYCFGDDAPVKLMGFRYNNDSNIDTVINPNSGNSYYSRERSEGALISPIPRPIYIYGVSVGEYKEIVGRLECI